ncbi:MAG TPA: NosD domain-containing protein [Hyalangium sp.]|nr:NosD domain-containing protein [Hyalangium sp.]
MNLRSPLTLSLLAGLLLAGCLEPTPAEPPGEGPSEPPDSSGPGDPVPPSDPFTLRVPIPQELREPGAVFVVSRLHESRPAQESVTAVAPGSQEFEIQGSPGEVLAISMLDRTGKLSQAAMVQAGASSWTAPKPQPRVLHVPSEYSTIQAAVDAASAGDTVLVKQGIYSESVRLKSGIRLLGNGAEVTILDGGGRPGRLVDFSGATDVVVAGFTFQNVGTGNVCDGLSVMDCGGNWYSAALYADGHTDHGEAPSSALVMHNFFKDNSIGALLYFHARAVVRNNIFVRNTHGFVANHFQGMALVANNVFWENTREAIVSQAAYLDIINNVVARSEVGIFHAYVQTGRIRCNLFFQNGANGADLHQVPPRFVIGQDGNIEADPRFKSTEAGGFHPAAGSPLIDAGCFESLDLDQDGARQDIGAYGGPFGRWP